MIVAFDRYIGQVEIFVLRGSVFKHTPSGLRIEKIKRSVQILKCGLTMNKRGFLSQLVLWLSDAQEFKYHIRIN